MTPSTTRNSFVWKDEVLSRSLSLFCFVVVLNFLPTLCDLWIPRGQFCRRQTLCFHQHNITVISPRLNLPIFPSQLGTGPLSCPLRNFQFFFCSCGREFKTRSEKILSEQAFQIDLLSHSRCMHVQYCTIVLL